MFEGKKWALAKLTDFTRPEFWSELVKTVTK